MSKNRLTLAGLLAACLLGLSSCASAPTDGGAQAGVPRKFADIPVTWQVSANNDGRQVPGELREAFDGFWRLYAGRDFAACYSLEAPEVRGLVGEDLYVAFYDKSYPLKAVEVLGVKELYDSDAVLTIRLTMTFNRKTGETRQVELEDNWLSMDGHWLHRLRDKVFLGGR